MGGSLHPALSAYTAAGALRFQPLLETPAKLLKIAADCAFIVPSLTPSGAVSSMKVEVVEDRRLGLVVERIQKIT